MRPFVSGLVLAAGASTRLGQPKQLLPYGTTTLLGRVVAEAGAASALDEVVVVIGGAATELRRHVHPRVWCGSTTPSGSSKTPYTPYFP